MNVIAGFMFQRGDKVSITYLGKAKREKEYEKENIQLSMQH